MIASKNDEIVVIDKMPASFTEPLGEVDDDEEGPKMYGPGPLLDQNNQQVYNSGSDDEIEE